MVFLQDVINSNNNHSKNLRVLSLNQFKKQKNDPDKYLLKMMSAHLSHLIQSQSGYLTIKNKPRINDINAIVVEEVKDSLMGIDGVSEIEILKHNGYGDLRLEFTFDYDNGTKVYEKKKTYYIEINCTTKRLDELEQNGSNNSFRSVYVSNMENITKHASHILIIIEFDGGSIRNTFRALGFRIYDLKNIEFHTKIEHSCSMNDILKQEALEKY